MKWGPRPEPQVVSLGRGLHRGGQVRGHSTSTSGSVTNTITAGQGKEPASIHDTGVGVRFPSMVRRVGGPQVAGQQLLPPPQQSRCLYTGLQVCPQPWPIPI